MEIVTDYLTPLHDELQYEIQLCEERKVFFKKGDIVSNKFALSPLYFPILPRKNFYNNLKGEFFGVPTYANIQELVENCAIYLDERCKIYSNLSKKIESLEKKVEEYQLNETIEKLISKLQRSSLTWEGNEYKFKINTLEGLLSHEKLKNLLLCLIIPALISPLTEKYIEDTMLEFPYLLQELWPCINLIIAEYPIEEWGEIKRIQDDLNELKSIDYGTMDRIQKIIDIYQIEFQFTNKEISPDGW